MSRDLDRLEPETRRVCFAFLSRCEERGLIVGIGETLRSREEQDMLYAQGRTRPGNIVTNARYPYSAHNWGVAFDIYRKDGAGAYDDSGGWFARCGEVGKSLGLCWGGDYRSFPDKPHFELDKYMVGGRVTLLLERYGTPENFMRTWKEDALTQEDFDKFMDNWLIRLGSLGVSAWAEDFIRQAVQRGLTNGERPRSFATREEVAAMIIRAGSDIFPEGNGKSY